MAVYLDTSCLLKVFFPEPETPATLELVAREQLVVVSSLARLEALSHVHARVAGKLLSVPAAIRLVRRIDAVLQSEPYQLRAAPAAMIDVAAAQMPPLKGPVYCRTLDRLHLAIMQVFELRRLLTNDDTQARAARALGLEVTLPR